MPRVVRANKITVRWSGEKALEQSLDDVTEKVRRGVLRALMIIALLLQSTARRGIQRGPKTGRLYERSKGSPHRASAPGEYPATDTGALVRSILGEVLESSLEAVLSAGTVYAKWLQFGTKDGKLKPRPFLTLALAEVKEKIVKTFMTHIKREMAR